MPDFEIDKNHLEEAVRHTEDAVTLNTSYSGRFMFGEKCVGVIGNLAGYGKFLLALLEVLEDADDKGFYDGEPYGDVYALAESVKMDNLGLDHVFYFPGVTVTE